MMNGYKGMILVTMPRSALLRYQWRDPMVQTHHSPAQARPEESWASWSFGITKGSHEVSNGKEHGT